MPEANFNLDFPRPWGKSKAYRVTFTISYTIQAPFKEHK